MNKRDFVGPVMREMDLHGMRWGQCLSDNNLSLALVVPITLPPSFGLLWLVVPQEHLRMMM